MQDSLSNSRWVKSSRCASSNVNCVEVAIAAPYVLIRDSKHRDGAVLAVNTEAWRNMIMAIKVGSIR